MQVSKKHLLGIGGLVLVGAMTAYAFTIPVPEASAYSASGQVQISVEVHGGVADIDVTTPTSGTVTLNHNMVIGLQYSQANKVSYTLTNTTAGTSVSNIYTPSSADGSDSLLFDLNNSGLGFGRYRFEASVNDGADYAYTTFNYVPLRMTAIGNDEDNNDPIVELKHAAGVATVELQAYDADGNALFPEPISVTMTNPDSLATQQVTLPFTAYGAGSGNYVVTAVSKDASGNVLVSVTGEVKADVKYAAPGSPAVPDTDDVTPDVPKTGGFLADLNIAQADYLITGLIVFSIASILAFVLLRKQSNKR